MIKYITFLIMVFSMHKTDYAKPQIIISELDTTELCFSCLMDTGRNLFLYRFAYPDQYHYEVSCIIKRGGRYSDTGFLLELNDIIKLDSGDFLEEFKLYSRYFKRVHLIYLEKKEKKLFKGFRFKTFNRKVAFNKNDIKFEKGYVWPFLNKLEYPYNKRKHLKTLSLSKGYIMKDVKIVY